MGKFTERKSTILITVGNGLKSCKGREINPTLSLSQWKMKMETKSVPMFNIEGSTVALKRRMASILLILPNFGSRILLLARECQPSCGSDQLIDGKLLRR